MFGISKKNVVSFRQRVAEFWEWYPSVAERFYQSIEAGECASLAPEVGKFVSKTLPHMGWVFGPGVDGGHSFTLTGEGNVARQLLAEHWLAAAPDIAGWTFHASRQPSSFGALKEMAIQIGENEQVDVENFLLKTTVDAEAEKIDIVAWHPTLASVPEGHHAELLFLLLDEALGEFGTEMWLGDVRIEPFETGEHTQTIATLPKFVEQVSEYHKWEKLPPIQSYSLYEISEQSNFKRGDKVVGTSCILDVIMDYLEHRGRLSDNPLKGTGAELAYLKIQNSVFPEGQQSEVRGKIEDALDDALQGSQGGQILGGAFGTDSSYVDMLLIDGKASRLTVQETLNSLQLHGLVTIESF